MNEGEDQRTQAEASAEKMTPEATARAIFEYLPQRGWQPPTEGTTDHDIQFVAAVIRYCVREYKPIGNFRQDLESLISCQGQIPDPQNALLALALPGIIAS